MTFGIRVTAFVGGVASLIAGVGLFATQVEYKPYGVHDLQREAWESMQADIRQRQEALSAAAAGELQLPRVGVTASQHDFRIQPPFATLEHGFQVRNDGQSDLKLTFQEASSDRLMCDVRTLTIAAGESASIPVRWQVADDEGSLRETLSFNTNDPRHHRLRLTVRSQVPQIVAFDQPRFSAPRVEPDQLIEAHGVVFSQCWDDFEIVEVRCPLDSFRWSAQPLSPAECREHDCLSGYRVTVSVSRSRRGTFDEPVAVSVRPDSGAWQPPADAAPADSPVLQRLLSEQPLELETRFYGRVIAPISFYHHQLDVNEGLDMGLMPCGVPQEFPLVVRCRGKRLPERLAVLDIQPPQLEASIQPLQSRPGTYRLVITVPAAAPQVVFNADQKHGYVQVGDPDHPEVSNWFPLMGAILDESRRFEQRK